MCTAGLSVCISMCVNQSCNSCLFIHSFLLVQIVIESTQYNPMLVFIVNAILLICQSVADHVILDSENGDTSSSHFLWKLKNTQFLRFIWTQIQNDDAFFTKRFIFYGLKWNPPYMQIYECSCDSWWLLIPWFILIFFLSTVGNWKLNGLLEIIILNVPL